MAVKRKKREIYRTGVEKILVWWGGRKTSNMSLFVTSSTNSVKVKKIFARVEMSRGNLQRFFPRCSGVEEASRGRRCKFYLYCRGVNK